MGIKHSFSSAKSPGADATKVRSTDWNDDHEVDGDVDFGGFAITNLEDEAYNQTAWNGSLEAPTKNAIRDKIEALVLTGGGVTDFLALDDTPDAYTDKGGDTTGPLGAFLQVNAAEDAVEFKFSTSNYIDIRDYGTVAGSYGDITAAFLAALEAYGVSHNQRRIRVPMVGNGKYELDGAALGANYDATGKPWIFDLDCVEIRLTSPWFLTSNMTVRGVGRALVTNLFLHGPIPQPAIYLASSATDAPAFMTRDNSPTGVNNFLIENLQFGGNLTHGTGLLISGALGTVRNCWFTSDGPNSALYIDLIFWLKMEDIYAEGRAAGDVAAVRICTDAANPITASGLATGLVRIKTLITARSGVKFVATTDSNGVANVEIIDLLSEGHLGGTPLLDFDSTEKEIENIRIIRPEIADAAVGTVYMIKNTAASVTSTCGVYIEGVSIRDELYDPASTHLISNIQLNYTTDGTGLGGVPVQMANYVAGTPSYARWRQDFRSSIDAKLMTAPIPGANWNYGTPILCYADPANWICSGTLTGGHRGPDGSLMAGQSNAEIRFGITSMTLALGDYLIGGVWVRGISGASAISGVVCSVTTDTSWEFNGVPFPDNFYNYDYDECGILADGWHWVCGATKVTGVGTNPVNIALTGNINAATNRYFFGPAAVVIRASEAEDDAWMIRMTRMLRGGWSSGAPAGCVSILDHQRLWSGSGMAVKDGVTAPSTVSGWAQIYVDTADGDLKVKFGDGTIKTIVVDT